MQFLYYKTTKLVWYTITKSKIIIYLTYKITYVLIILKIFFLNLFLILGLCGTYICLIYIWIFLFHK